MELNVAIVEDEKQLNHNLKGLIQEWGARNNCMVNVYQYSSGEEIDFEKNYLFFDGIFMDIRFPNGKNGLEIAQIIREKDAAVPIAFTTSFMEYSIAGYDVGAVRFIVKPVQYSDVEICMTKCRCSPKQK